MATRSIIARSVNGSWQGNYHHWHGYPSGIGRELWDLYHGFFKRDLSHMLTVLIDEHRGGWSNIIGRDWTQPPGFVELTTRMAEGHPDETFGPECYCHGERKEGPYPYITPENGNWGANYLYVIDAEAKTMTISRHQYPANTWQELTMLNFNSDEPDWDNLD